MKIPLHLLFSSKNEFKYLWKHDKIITNILPSLLSSVARQPRRMSSPGLLCSTSSHPRLATPPGVGALWYLTGGVWRSSDMCWHSVIVQTHPDSGPLSPGECSEWRCWLRLGWHHYRARWDWPKWPVRDQVNDVQENTTSLTTQRRSLLCLKPNHQSDTNIQISSSGGLRGNQSTMSPFWNWKLPWTSDRETSLTSGSH